MKFEKLNQLYLNGILTGYNVTLSGKDYHVIITNSTDVTFTSLKKFSLYEVRVKACNRIGCGPESQLRSQRTLEDGKKLTVNISYQFLSHFLKKFISSIDQHNCLSLFLLEIPGQSFDVRLS